jgi:hypothetical protein
MTGPDLVASPAAFAETAAGIDAVLDGLRAAGSPAAAELGRRVAALGPVPGDVGHAGLSCVFVVFCDRWEWALRAAVRRGEDLADELRAAGDTYGHAEGEGHDLLARLVDDVVGDPGTVGDTWEDVAAAVLPDRRMPDWGELGGQWADTAGDLADHSWPALIARVLSGENPYAGQLDDLRSIAG